MIETKFKNTEIGPIPVDWEVKTLGDIGSLLPNNTLSWEFLSGGSSVSNIHYGQILTRFGYIVDILNTDLPIISKSLEAKFVKSIKAQDGDIIFADTAEDSSVGKAIELINVGNKKVVSGLHTFWYRPKISFAPNFLGYLVNGDIFHSQIPPKATGTKVSSISKPNLLKLTLSYPTSLAEQEAIGKALREVDELIEGLKKLVAKKRAIKHGAMSQLLSGKTRLPGFSDSWEKVTLGEIGETFGGLSGKTKSDFNTGTAKYITFLNVIRNIRIQPSLFEAVNVGANEKQHRVLKGDLLFNTSSETPEEVALCSVLTEDIDNLYLNSFCFGFRLKKNDVKPIFIAYLLRTKEGRHLMSKTAAGVTRFNVSKKKFLSTSIYLPSLAEQEALAKVLTDMDEEIEALNKKIAKYEQVKQGMMQQLLTGKIRLI